MPIDYHIDHARRLVQAEGYGTVTDEDVFRYQREVWSRTDVAGYDELVDMTEAREIIGGSTEKMRELASLSAATDPPTGAGRFAIVAPQDLAFGVGRMYQVHRGLNERSTREVGVFRDRDSALAWLAALGPASGAAPADPTGS